MVDAEGTIRIDKSQLPHAGRYVCTAKNAAGSDQRLTNVVVQGEMIDRKDLDFFEARPYFIVRAARHSARNSHGSHSNRRRIS